MQNHLTLNFNSINKILGEDKPETYGRFADELPDILKQPFNLKEFIFTRTEYFVIYLGKLTTI